jgi:serine/threonine protein kinase
MNEPSSTPSDAGSVPDTLATTPPSPEETLPPPDLPEREIAERLREGFLAPLPARFGRYTLRQLLGQGGMGVVYLAHDTQLDRLVALKVPRFGRTPRQEDRERFYREARAAAGVSHPNLCPVYDVGEIEGVAYLTMAYLEGTLLSVLAKSSSPLPIPRSLTLVAHMARAMQEVHRRGIIHRDLKPGNVMIDVRDQPIIMDFGLARRGPESGDVRLTHEGAVMGTPAYMPPEQIRGSGDQLGPGCDIYSLGMILYELLAGTLPFSGTAGELFAQILTGSPSPPSRFRPDLDPDLDALCLKALARVPADRYTSMQEFAEALERYPQSSAGQGEVVHRAGTESARKEEETGSAPETEESARLYFAARYHQQRRTEAGLRKSIATYSQILDQDPSSARAWAGLALAYQTLSVWGYAAPISACPKAKQAARRALALDSTLADAHLTLAAVLMEYDWNLEEAEKTFRHALALDPEHAIGHLWYGKCLACQGRHEEAIAEFRHAQELDSLSATVTVALGRHGFILARRYSEAIEYLRQTTETEPGCWITHRFLGWAYLLRGDTADALRAFTTARQLDDNLRTFVELGYAWALAGQPDKAREALDALPEWARRGYVSPDSQALLYLGLGDREQTLSWLEKVAEARSEWLCKFFVDPVLDPVRSEPRFQALLRRVKGHPESGERGASAP